MSSHTRTLDQIARLADDTVVDALFIVRRKPWHWPLVALGIVVGLAVGLVVGMAIGQAVWFFALSGVIVGGGLGMNVGTDFRFIARTPSQMLLLDSSRVSAHPTRVVKTVNAVRVEPAVVSADLYLDEELHVMARQHLTRLERML
ncbi:MAG: hypothetical protein HY828_13850 [Actinobacteria bacterium]|nr:hypothetical protein [Actinomycetota bacterium]